MRRGLALYAARRARAEHGGCCAVVTNSNGNRARPCRHDAVTAFDVKMMRYCTKHEDHWEAQTFRQRMEMKEKA